MLGLYKPLRGSKVRTGNLESTLKEEQHTDNTKTEQEKEVRSNVTTHKKKYSEPVLVVHGDVKKLTQQNGTSFTDVPQGTNAGVDGGVVGDLGSSI